MSDPYVDQVRWFDALGSCGKCGKPATGKLMGPRNESYGAYCRPCAERRLNKAEKERAKIRAVLDAPRLGDGSGKEER